MQMRDLDFLIYAILPMIRCRTWNGFVARKMKAFLINDDCTLSQICEARIKPMPFEYASLSRYDGAMIQKDKLTDVEPVMSAIVERHFEEFGSLWATWRELLDSDELTAKDLQPLESRILAHFDGLLVSSNPATQLSLERIRSDNPDDVFAAAFFLLRNNHAETVVVSLESPDALVTPIKDALCASEIGAVEKQLQEICATGDAPCAVAAAEVLAMHGKLDRNHSRIADFFQDERPDVRAAAWRMVAMDPR
jgi:hypothetical protein